MNATCPRTDQINDFVVGTLANSDSDALCMHVDDCGVCQDSLEIVTRNAVANVDLPRVPVERLRRGDNEDLSRLIVRMRQLCDEGHSNDVSDIPNTTPAVPESLGEYDILEELGRGGMGTVYRARHRLLDRIDAVKVISAERMETERQVQRFRREMANVAKLQHPNFVRAYTAGVDGGQHFLAMEFVDGPTVSVLLRRHGRMSIADASEIARQTALGLQSADEAQLVHRDIKPSNLMIDVDGAVRVLDLGLAVSVVQDAKAISESGLIVGTLDYIAPEQIEAQETVDIRADLYGLGCSLFRLLTGRPPYQKGPGGELALLDAHLRHPIPSPAAFRDDVPVELAQLIEQLLAKDRVDRPRTAAEVAKRLEPFCDGADLTAFARQHQRPIDSAAQFSERPTISGLTTDTDRHRHHTKSLPPKPSKQIRLWSGGVLTVAVLAAVLLTIVIRIRGVDVVVNVDSAMTSGESITIRIGTESAVVKNDAVTLRLSPGDHTFELVTREQAVIETGRLNVRYFGANTFQIGSEQQRPPKPSSADNLVSVAVEYEGGTESISGSLFEDRNGDGDWNSGEAAVAGQLLWLLTPDRKAILMPGGIEPDDYPRNMDVSTVNPRVVLSATGSEAVNSKVHADRRETAATGTHVFEMTNQAEPDIHHTSIFRATRRELRADFVAPAKTVQIDVVGNEDGSVGRLSAFRSDGSLLQIAESKRLTEGQMETLLVTSESYEIAAVIATGNTSDGVRLDNFRFTGLMQTRSRSDGSYRFDNLSAQVFRIEVGARNRLPLRTVATSAKSVTAETTNLLLAVSDVRMLPKQEREVSGENAPPANPGTITDLLIRGKGMLTQDFAFVADLSHDSWEELAYAMTAIQLYPTRIRPFQSPDGLRMSVVFHRDNGTIQIVGDRTATGMTEKINTLQAAGLLLHDVAGYADGDFNQYFATLITNHDSFGPAEFFVGVPEGEHSDRHRDFLSRGCSVRTRQFFRGHDGTVRHSGIWIPPGDTPESSSVYHGKSALERIAKGYPMADIDLRTNDDGDDVVVSGCFRKDADWTSAICGPTDATTHLKLCHEQAVKGFIPLTVTSAYLQKERAVETMSVWESRQPTQ